MSLQTEFAQYKRYGNRLRERWKFLALAAAAGLALSVYLTSPEIKQPEYQAETTLVIPSKQLLTAEPWHRENFRGYGISWPNELLAFAAHLRSDAAFRHITKKFNLLEHYNLAGEGSEHRKYKRLRQYYDDKTAIDVVRKGRIRIRVLDVDPKLAAQMANELAAYGDRQLKGVARRRQALASLEAAIDSLESLSAEARDSMTKYRAAYDIYDVEEIAENVSAAVLRKAFRNPQFHLNYDKTLSFKQTMKEHAISVRELSIERQRLLADLESKPVLVEATPAVAHPVIERPKRALLILVNTIAFVLCGAMLTIFTEELIARKPADRSACD